jgi:hypothetical protein
MAMASPDARADTELVSVVVPSTAGREAIGSFWKESHAERRVLAKVRISCKRVHPVTRKDKTCDRKAQLKALERRNAFIAELEETIRTAEDGSWQQVQAMGQLSQMNHENFTPAYYLARIRFGYRLTTARCTGTGTPDRSGDRFSRFRCDAVAQGSELSPRLAVRVTGRTTFHWTIV